MVTSIHSIPENDKRQLKRKNSKTKWNKTEDSRFMREKSS